MNLAPFFTGTADVTITVKHNANPVFHAFAVQARHNMEQCPPRNTGGAGDYHSARKWREIRAILSAAPKSELLVPPVLAILALTLPFIAAIGG